MNVLLDLLVAHPYVAIVVCTVGLGIVGSVIGAATGLLMEVIFFRNRS